MHLVGEGGVFVFVLVRPPKMLLEVVLQHLDTLVPLGDLALSMFEESGILLELGVETD